MLYKYDHNSHIKQLQNEEVQKSQILSTKYCEKCKQFHKT